MGCSRGRGGNLEGGEEGGGQEGRCIEANIPTFLARVNGFFLLVFFPSFRDAPSVREVRGLLSALGWPRWSVDRCRLPRRCGLMQGTHTHIYRHASGTQY